jgi:predicted ATPase
MNQLEHLSLENYKSFKNWAEIEIRPLTLFYGYNSAGKSAALRFLQLLADSTNGSGFGPLNLRSEVLKGASFSSLLSKHSSSPRVNIALKLGDTVLEIVVLNLPDRRTQVIEEIGVKAFDSEIVSSFKWLPKDDESTTGPQTYQFTDASEYAEVELSFDGLVPCDYPAEFDALLGPVAEALKDFGENFSSLSPDCIIPERFQVEVSPAKNVSRRGSGMTSMLQAAPQSVINEISDWYKVATGYSFKRQRITIGDQSGHRFTLHPNADDKIDIDIIDTGEGMGQVLPVIGLLMLAKNFKLGSNPVLSLEHPELHIHPDAHVHLANLFCEAITSEAKPRILVETHSENLLLGIQLALAEKRIKPTDVAVHWVRGTDEGAVVELIEFDEKARPINENWPIEVFRANSKLARNLFEKRKASDD